MAEVVLDRICKTYGTKYQAIKDLSLTVHDGEFLILVGPSGCGKSTALRMIAGLEEISSGTLSIGGENVVDLAPKDRDIAMVFQSYALYPHMTVFDNIAFSMKLAGKSKAERTKRVNEIAKTLQLHTLLDSKPASLSGGQRQRVAMGRAMVREPAAFLMDEPLVEPRRQAARADARRDRQPAAAARGDHDLRDPRPDRGPDHGRPGRGAEGRRAPAGRHARRRSTTGRSTCSSPASSARRR